jgi:hypothetical protein
MSFQKNITHNKTHNRKEKDSHSVNHLHPTFFQIIERTSVFTSRGSLTLEAALVVPLFFFAILSLVSLFQMKVIQTTVKGAFYSVAKEIGERTYLSPVITSKEVENKLVSYIGEERLEESLVVGGADGLSCFGSLANWNTAQMHLVVKYQLKAPILMFNIPAVSCKETLKIKGWSGYMSEGTGSEEREVVYVAQNGSVYHKDMYCTFLNVSVRGIFASTIQDARNSSGAKYYKCETCGNDKHIGIYYVSKHGDRYHTTLNCSKIKRNVYAMPLEDAKGLGGCSKCVK